MDAGYAWADGSGKDRNRLFEMTDPRGIATCYEWDNQDRLTKLIEAYVDGTPSDGDDRITLWTYDGLGNIRTMTADLPGTDQTTTYNYQARLSPGTGPASAFNSNSHLSSIAYTTVSLPPFNFAQNSTEYFGMNRLGEQIGWRDRNTSVHAYTRDLLGRLTLDDVTTLGANVDGTVRKLAYGYDDAGLLYLMTSKDGSSTVLNQVERTYNGLGQLTQEKQEHDGAVDGSTIGVGYGYSEMPSGANHSRLTSMTYPDGTILAYGYGTGGGLDDLISRLFKQTWDSTDVETYAYLGLATVVERDRPEASHTLTYLKQGLEIDGEAGDKYAGLDRFGRIIDQRWTLDGGGHAERFGYGYDRNSNRLWRKNELSGSHSELYMADAADEQAAYDKLNRLTHFQRGTLSDAVGSDGYYDTVSTASREQSWSLDALGNWKDVTTDGVAEYREHDGQNRLEKIDDDSDLAYDDFDGTPVADLLYSNNGELRVDQDGKIFIYDAWGRLVSVNTDGSGGAEVTYGYDAVYRRIDQTGQHLYYSAGWQVLEERNSASAGYATHQYVWSPVYVDAMVLRDRDANASADGNLEERIYITHDAQFSVTALIGLDGSSWVVLERFIYDPYGTRTVLDANWAVDGDGLSDRHLTFGHQGGWVDLLTNTVHSRFRDGYSTLGRWFWQDPAGYRDGLNRYQMYGCATPSSLDPIGLDVIVDRLPNIPDAIAKETEASTPEVRKTIKDQIALARSRNIVAKLLFAALEWHEAEIYIDGYEGNRYGASRTHIYEPRNNQGNDPHDRPKRIVIFHDPDYVGPDSNPNPPLDPEATLVHEAVHALLLACGLQDALDFNHTTAYIVENIHRASMGLDPVLKTFEVGWLPQLPDFIVNRLRP